MDLQSSPLEDIAEDLAKMHNSIKPDKAPKEKISLFYTFDARGYDCFFPVKS